MKIAVLVDGNDQAISFDEVGKVKLYQKDNSSWKVEKEMVFGVNNLMSIHEIRERIRNMADALDDCKVFVATEANGVPYTILEGLGFNIWKMKGSPTGFLDYIAESEEEQKSEAAKSTEKPGIVKADKEGFYFIDLKTILEKDENLTSKQILMPFLQNAAFTELEVICTHVPRWFDKEFDTLKLSAVVEPMDADRVTVKVRPK